MPQQSKIFWTNPYQTGIPITPSLPSPTTLNDQKTVLLPKSTEQQFFLLIQWNQ